MHLVEESGIDESDKNNVASRGKMLLHIVKSLEYWSFTAFFLFIDFLLWDFLRFLCFLYSLTLSTFCLNWAGVVMLPAVIRQTSFPQRDRLLQ